MEQRDQIDRLKPCFRHRLIEAVGMMRAVGAYHHQGHTAQLLCDTVGRIYGRNDSRQFNPSNSLQIRVGPYMAD